MNYANKSYYLCKSKEHWNDTYTQKVWRWNSLGKKFHTFKERIAQSLLQKVAQTISEKEITI